MTEPYPPTRTEHVEEVLAGVRFADPYRWLEADTDEVRAWQHAQSRLASSHVREWAHFEKLHRLVVHFSTERQIALPRHAAGRWFRTRVAQGASQAQAIVSAAPTGEGRVLFDPSVENPAQPPFLSWISPSPDGALLAVGICADGSENNTIRLIDVETGKALPNAPPHTLMDNWTGGVHWLSDSSGFFYTAIAGAAVAFEQTVYLHRLKPPTANERVDVPWRVAHDYRMVTVSRDGRYAVAVERLQNPVPLAIAPLTGFPLRWHPFLTRIEGTVAGHLIGNDFIAVTDVGAPRGRLVAIALDCNEPNDPRNWRELVAESEAVLRTVTPVGQLLYLTEFVDTFSRIRVVDMAGDPHGAVPSPAAGAIGEFPFPLMNLTSRGHPEVFLFSFSSLTESAGLYSHRPGENGIEVLEAPKVRLENAVVESRWAVSRDGTRVPYHILRGVDVPQGVAQPTLIYAYGGYNVPRLPAFPGAMASFVAAGGVFVHAHLRGGGEFGLDWWRAGRLKNKQNGYDDLYAVAEDLVAANVCTCKTLAVTGGSNGGLMAAVAATQRPELWAVVVPRIPLLDLIGACRESYGRQAVMEELADIEEPDEVRRLATFSPYHLIRDRTSYPAVFVDAGATDPRCPPWHARKFTARLQSASSSGCPILLHVWENVGHGWATDRAVAALEHTEWLAFTLSHLGVTELSAG